MPRPRGPDPRPITKSAGASGSRNPAEAEGRLPTPRSGRTRINEFLPDLVEFLQKHFDLVVDRTRVDDDPGRILVVLRHTPTDSLLEIEAAGDAAAFRFAGAAWEVAGGGDPDALRETLLIEALGVLRGRIVTVTAWAGSTALGRAAARDAAAAAAALAAAHPRADRLTVKAWGSPESDPS